MSPETCVTLERDVSTDRPRVAAVVTEYRGGSHAQQLIDRLLWGYSWHGRHHQPAIDVVSMYIDQVAHGHIGQARAELFPSMRIYPTIAEALTLGGQNLAVDGVILIGEHGDYPQNEKCQNLWPRYEFFCQAVEIFRDSGRSVPVFNDKHFSWKWEWAVEMVETAAELGFPMMAGSSIPYSCRLPPVDMPLEARVEEAVCIGPGGIDGYDIHALEAAQCLLERREDGETGVVSMRALELEAVWDAMEIGSWEGGGWDRTLFETCLYRSRSIAHLRDAPTNAYHDRRQMQALVDHPPVAYRYEYADGTRATMLLLEGLIHDFTFAARLAGEAELLSLLMHQMPQADTFIPFVNAIERFMVTGVAPVPVERTLLTTGLTAAGVESLYQGQVEVETPHLEIRYRPPAESLFWRG